MKNKMMRIASVLLVAALITTCAISGTFAKYITQVEGKDQARVAKWGIVLGMETEGFFKTEYKTDETADKYGYEGLSVKADGTDQEVIGLVAPGTKGDALKATVDGAPEVATRYILEIPADWADVVLPAGKYTDYTKLVAKDGEYGYFDTFTLEKDYAPVKWDITVKKGSTEYALTEVANSTPAFQALAAAMGGNEYGFSATNAKAIVEQYADQLEELILTLVTGAQNAKFEVADDGAIRLSLDFEPNKTMGFEFGLKWAWKFTDAENETDVTLNDKADTYLGNVIAGALIDDNVQEIADADAKVSVKLNFNFKATAVQID